MAFECMTGPDIVLAAPPSAVPAGPPSCVIVTGPRGAGKTRWLQDSVRRLRELRPTARAAILLAEEGRTRLENFCQETSGVTLGRLALPCLCCPGAAGLQGMVMALVRAAQADWLFLELPVLAAPGLLAEFDRDPGWPRSFVVCLTPRWAEALAAQEMPPFQAALFEEADAIIAGPVDALQAMDRLFPPALSLAR